MLRFFKSRFLNSVLFTVLFLGLYSCKTVQPIVEHPIIVTTLEPSKSVVINNSSYPKFSYGADNYEGYATEIAGKSVAIVTNQTGVLSNNMHLVDFLVSKNVSICKIFAPEHGFRGNADAGETVLDGKDPKTGLPIFSLYGSHKKPSKDQLEDIDVIIFDIQDVGVRFYTYISSLHYVMEACAENKIQLLVLDRPNPNGTIVDGPVLEKEFTSFVGMHPIPILHGMTIGEYAQMINGEKWLKKRIQCDLKVIACSDYNRKMPFHLPEKPSPNLPNDQSINLYASLCLFEGTNVSVGRGTEKQFQLYGSPYLPKPSYAFTPKPNFGAKDPLYNGIECYGEDLSKIPKISQLEIKWLIKAYNLTDDKYCFFNPFFPKLSGTNKLQEQIENGFPEEEIRESWKEGIEQFLRLRKRYLIYGE